MGKSAPRKLLPRTVFADMCVPLFPWATLTHTHWEPFTLAGNCQLSSSPSFVVLFYTWLSSNWLDHGKRQTNCPCFGCIAFLLLASLLPSTYLLHRFGSLAGAFELCSSWGREWTSGEQWWQTWVKHPLHNCCQASLWERLLSRDAFSLVCRRFLLEIRLSHYSKALAIHCSLSSSTGAAAVF